jgi:hypothetical protein
VHKTKQGTALELLCRLAFVLEIHALMHCDVTLNGCQLTCPSL